MNDKIEAFARLHVPGAPLLLYGPYRRAGLPRLPNGLDRRRNPRARDHQGRAVESAIRIRTGERENEAI